MRRRGFTVVEALLAVVFLVVLALGVSVFLRELSNASERATRFTRGQQSASAIMASIEGAVAASETVGPDGRSGVRGDRTSLTIAHRTLGLDLEGRDGPSAGGQVLSVRFANGRTVARIVAGGVDVTGGEVEVSDRIERMDFRYHDGEGWRESFDSLAAGGLPMAIEVSIWLVGVDEDAAPVEALGDGGGRSVEELFDELGESGGGGMGLPTLEDLRSAAEGEDRVWGAPDRLRVFAIPDAGFERELEELDGLLAGDSSGGAGGVR